MARRFVKRQRLKVVSSDKPPGDSSPYWRHYHEKESEGENPQANPDVLNDERNNLLWPAKHTETELEILEELKGVDFAKLLTRQEAKILSLIVNEQKSVEEIQCALGLSKRRIYALQDSAGKKIRRHLKLDE